MPNNTTPRNNRTMLGEYCHMGLPAVYDFYWLVAYSSLTVVGLFYAVFGRTEFGIATCFHV